MAELAQEKEAFCRKGQKDEERVSKVQAQLKEMARQLASSEHSHQEQSLRMRRVQQELHEQSLASGAAKQELVIKSDKLDSLQRQNQNLMDTKDQLESNLTKARAETAELASRVLQLETKCSSLEGAGRDAEQQHRHDHSYQNELLVDRQQATQDAQRLRQELASAKHTATQQEHALHMQRASLKQELEHVTARNAALNARVQEQAEHLKISLAAVTNLQHSDIHAHIHVFNSQANSLLHRYQAVLAQASGNDAVAGRNQANKTIRAVQGMHFAATYSGSRVACRDPSPALWEPLPQPDLASPRTVAGSPAASPGRACDPGRSHRTLPMQIWADNSCSSSSSLAMGMQTVQESLQAEYDELYEHYQELAEQVMSPHGSRHMVLLSNTLCSGAWALQM
ncbi:hypothetical protein WJX79_003137 [Trebouxia sp. C0005]